MDKTTQKKRLFWLKSQKKPIRKWLRLVTAIAFFNALLIIAQAGLLADILHAVIIEHSLRTYLIPQFLLLIIVVIVRSGLIWAREKASFRCGQLVRQTIRQQIFAKLEQLGPVWLKSKPTGSWSTIIIEQVENIHDYYARYLPQMRLAMMIPFMILVAVLPINWVAALILTVTAPLIPLFMAMVGTGAAEANRRNFIALARLSGHFLDRLKGIDTLRIFNQGHHEIGHIAEATENFRQKTMAVLRLAFLSAGLLEFFASVSIAIVAVYFGFSYLGELNFGHYGLGVTLFAGFLALILAPEFYQPLRDLGAFYHAKAQAIGAAEALVNLLECPIATQVNDPIAIDLSQPITITAQELIILSPEGKPLAGPLSFVIQPNDKIAIVGQSGAGKTSLCQVLMGFLPYQGHLLINGHELKQLNLDDWRQHIGWLGQEPYLPTQNIRDNIVLTYQVSDSVLNSALSRAYVDEFLPRLPAGLSTKIGDDAIQLSVGQAQRIALARTFLLPRSLLLLDEPTAGLDYYSEKLILTALQDAAQQQTTLMITHRLANIEHYPIVWVMHQGKIVEQGNYQTLNQRTNSYFRQLLVKSGEVL